MLELAGTGALAKYFIADFIFNNDVRAGTVEMHPTDVQFHDSAGTG